MNAPRVWCCADRTIRFDEPKIMGVINVTPDSFSDGGSYDAPEAAVAHAMRLAEEGADILDVGGESTRPGAEPVSVEAECERVLPVIEALARLSDLPISIDTRKAAVAEEALKLGACIVNDVSGGAFDPRLLEVVRASGAGLVIMHMRGTPPTMQDAPRYDDVIAEVRDELRNQLDAARSAGIAPDAVALDPGIGFGKTTGHNLELLAALEQIRSLGAPVLVGASRKRLVGELTGRPVGDRLAGSLAVLVWAVLHGADMVRVHDVAASRDALRVAMALSQTRSAQGG